MHVYFAVQTWNNPVTGADHGIRYPCETRIAMIEGFNRDVPDYGCNGDPQDSTCTNPSEIIPPHIYAFLVVRRIGNPVLPREFTGQLKINGIQIG
jgi:hypothetical protein